MTSTRVCFSDSVMKVVCSGLLLFLLSMPLQAALPVAVDGIKIPSLAPMLERTTPAVVNIADGGGVIHPKLTGATLGEMREQHLQRGRVDYLEVMKVERGSNADASGFQVGDIIYSINKQLTRTFDEVFALVETNGKAMMMNNQRGNRELYLLLK